MKAGVSPKRQGMFSAIDPVALGVLSSFAASASYGLGTVITRQAVSGGASPMVAALFSLLDGSATMVLFSARHLGTELKAPRRTYLNLGIAGAFAMLGIVLLYIALAIAPVAVVSPVSSLSPMFSLLFSHFFLQRMERVTPKIVLGTVLVLGGVVIITVSSM